MTKTAGGQLRKSLSSLFHIQLEDWKRRNEPACFSEPVTRPVHSIATKQAVHSRPIQHLLFITTYLSPRFVATNAVG